MAPYSSGIYWIFLFSSVSFCQANIYDIARVQYTEQQPQQYGTNDAARTHQFHAYNSVPGVQYTSQEHNFYPNQAAINTAQQYSQVYTQQQTQSAPVQIDQANLAKYSQYLDILQKAYGIQLPGELSIPAATASGQDAHSNYQQQQLAAQQYGVQPNPYVQQGVMQVQPNPYSQQTSQNYVVQSQTQQPYIPSPQPQTYLPSNLAPQQPYTSPEKSQQPQTYLPSNLAPQQPYVPPQQPQQPYTSPEKSQQPQTYLPSNLAPQQPYVPPQQPQQPYVPPQQPQQPYVPPQKPQQPYTSPEKSQQPQTYLPSNLAPQQPYVPPQQPQQPYTSPEKSQQPQTYLPSNLAPQQPYMPPQKPQTYVSQQPHPYQERSEQPIQNTAQTYKSNYQTAALGQSIGQPKPQVYTYPGATKHQKTHGNGIEEETEERGSVVSAPYQPPPPPPPTQTTTMRVVPTRPIATVTRAPVMITKSQTTRRPPTTTAITTIVTEEAVKSSTESTAQTLTQQIRKLPAVLYIDSRLPETKKTETLLRDTYGLPLVTFYIDKTDKAAAIQRQLQTLTAHKGLPYLFICGTFIGSEQHIENYHSNGQIPQLVEYVCSDEKKKSKSKKTKTKKTTS